jgi:hypothetical protein
MATNLALIIAGVALKFTAASRIPNVPYNTQIDSYILFSFYLMLLISVENSFVAGVLNGVFRWPAYYWDRGWQMRTNYISGDVQGSCDVAENAQEYAETVAHSLLEHAGYITLFCLPLFFFVHYKHGGAVGVALLGLAITTIAVSNTKNRITGMLDDNDLELDCHFYRFWGMVDWSCAWLVYCLWMALQIWFFVLRYQVWFERSKAAAFSEKIRRKQASASMHTLTQSRWQGLSQSKLISLSAANSAPKQDKAVATSSLLKRLSMDALAQANAKKIGSRGEARITPVTT